jgi:hypothetical protein
MLSFSTFAAGLVLLPGSAFANGLVFNTTYQAANGQTLSATVTIDGNLGSYTSYDQTGRPVGGGTLSNLKYANLGGQQVLKGQWQWNGGGQGNFVWYLDGSLSFNGNWSMAGGNGGGQWSGSLDYGQGQLGGGGPSLVKKRKK